MIWNAADEYSRGNAVFSVNEFTEKVVYQSRGVSI